MDHNLGVRKRNTLALGARGEQERTHARRHTDADGGHIALDILHGIVNCHTGSNAAAGRVDVELDVLIRIFCLKEQKLGNDQACRCFVDLFAQEDNAVLQQAGENVVRPLTAVGLFNDVRD